MKRPHEKDEKISCRQEEIFVNRVSDKKLISVICKVLSKLDSYKRNNPIRNWAKDISPKRMYADGEEAHGMQAKGTVRYHCPSIITSNNPMCGPGFGAAESIAGAKVKWCSRTEGIWQFPTKLTMCVTHNPAIVLLGICPREVKIQVHTNTLVSECLSQLYL